MSQGNITGWPDPELQTGQPLLEKGLPLGCTIGRSDAVWTGHNAGGHNCQPKAVLLAGQR